MLVVAVAVVLVWSCTGRSLLLLASSRYIIPATTKFRVFGFLGDDVN
jgi:hypothetical protein